MAESLQIGADEGQDPGVVPEDAEGDAQRVTIKDDQSSVNVQDDAVDADDRPEWLPEKFKSPAEMAKAYAELEKKQSTPAEKAAEDAGLDMKALQQEWQDNDGELPQETYTKLAEAGFDQDTVDSFIAGQQALASQLEAGVHDTVGGKEQYAQMLQWAATNLSQEEITAFDNAVTSGDMAMAKMAARGLHASYVEANGSDPSLVKGNTTPARGPKPYGSDAEIVRDMGSQKYKTDPAFRAQVAERLNVTNF
jgi:hypothetical protein